MKKSKLLNKLKKEEKLELVEPSDEICTSYLEKADNCLLSAKILFQHDIYENSISEAYYAMYNSLLALLFKTGIKCENHTASIIILKKIFGRTDLSKIIKKAKKERIDKQYYVTSKKDFTLSKETAQNMLSSAEDFLIKMKLLIKNITIVELNKLRENFSILYSDL